MADHSRIEWTDATWQIASGCSPVSAGCRNCYSSRLAGTRLKHHPRCQGLTRKAEDGRHVWTGEVRLHPDQLAVPLSWRKGRRIFVGDRTDLFHPSIPDDYIDRVLAVMALCPQHTFQILTKRPERMREYLSAARRPGQIARACVDMVVDPTIITKRACRDNWPVMSLGDDPDWPDDITLGTWPLPNVWLGTSIEDQTTADVRIPHLLAAPAAVRFVSAEPLLGAVDLTAVAKMGMADFTGNSTRFNSLVSAQILDPSNGSMWTPRPDLDLVIVGGESGPHARPMHPDWARSLRDQCAAAGVAFLFKQWGEWGPTLLIWSEARGKGPPCVAWPDGTIAWGRAEDHGGDGITLARVGKSAAGRLLDGVKHNGMPEVRP